MIRTLAFVALVTCATVQGSLALWGFRHDAARRDFGHLVASAKSWHEEGVLYDDPLRTNLNPPHASVVLFTPLTWVSFDTAVKCWVVVQLVTLLITIVVIARELRLPPASLEWIVP